MQSPQVVVCYFISPSTFSIFNNVHLIVSDSLFYAALGYKSEARNTLQSLGTPQ